MKKLTETDLFSNKAINKLNVITVHYNNTDIIHS